MQIKKVITPDNLDETIVFKSGTGKWGVNESALGGQGLDCEAIKALPAKPWSSDTKVLAQDANGNCYRLTSLEGIISDVGVAFSAAKYSGFVGDEYQVTATVTNTGQATVSTTLFLVKPQGDNYRIKNWITSSDTGVTISRVSDLEYRITGLSTAKRAIVKFTVVPSESTTLQFGANVKTDGFDISSANDNDSIILSANTKQDPSYTPTVDCPAITVTDITTGKALALTRTTTSGNNTYLDALNHIYNVYDMSDLAGLSLRIKNASTVAVYHHPTINGVIMTQANANVNAVELQSGYFAQTLLYSMHLNVDGRTVPSYRRFGATLSSDVTFDGGVLTFGSTFTDKNALVFARPAGENCRWQAFLISCRLQPSSPKTVNVSGLSSSNVSKTYNFTKHGRKLFPSNNVSANLITGEVKQAYISDDSNESGSQSNPIIKSEHVEINLQRGQAYSFTITTNFISATVETSGAVNITTHKVPSGGNSTTYTVSVRANAMPTDSISLADVFEININ